MAKEDKTGAKRIVLQNRKARFEYFIEDTIKAGLVLAGTEVKSLRAGRASLAESYAKLDKNGEAWLHNMHINPHEEGGRYNPDPVRNRKLLLTRRELGSLKAVTEQKGFSLVPVSLFFENGFAKLELGIGRGKKLYDKRESIAERDRERDARREAFGRD
ncbi:MAG: SsrA-binding protein SmpB [Armatimonadetes bacterium]|nr:SsrA-binding protein SmpB [Armatimonadota bacterium]